MSSISQYVAILRYNPDEVIKYTIDEMLEEWMGENTKSKWILEKDKKVEEKTNYDKFALPDIKAFSLKKALDAKVSKSSED